MTFIFCGDLHLPYLKIYLFLLDFYGLSNNASFFDVIALWIFLFHLHLKFCHHIQYYIPFQIHPWIINDYGQNSSDFFNLLLITCVGFLVILTCSSCFSYKWRWSIHSDGLYGFGNISDHWMTLCWLWQFNCGAFNLSLVMVVCRWLSELVTMY